MQLFDHNLGAITYVLLLSCTKPVNYLFRIFCTVQWGISKSALLSWGSLLGAGGSKIYYLHRLLRDWGLPGPVLFSTISRLLKLFEPSEDSTASRRGLLISSLNVSTNSCYGQCFNVPSNTLNFSWTVKAEISICENTRLLKYMF